MVPRVGGAESDGVTSNYVVVGRAPGLDLGLHEDDFSVLWQVIGVPILWRCCGCQTAESLGPTPPQTTWLVSCSRCWCCFLQFRPAH